jgi:hypothetical protein
VSWRLVSLFKGARHLTLSCVTSIQMRIRAFWHIASCGPLVSIIRAVKEAGRTLKRRSASKRLHDGIFRNALIFLLAAVRTWKLTLESSPYLTPCPFKIHCIIILPLMPRSRQVTYFIHIFRLWFVCTGLWWTVRSCGSSVSVVSDYRLDYRGSIPDWGKVFL